MSAVVAAVRDRPVVKLNLLSSSVLAGVGLFFLNSAGRDLVGLPLAEFAFIALLLLSPKAPVRRANSAGWVALWFAVVLLAVLGVVSDVLNGLGPFDMGKDGSRLLLLFAPALLYATAARPEWFLGVVLGFILADSWSAGLATAGAIIAGSDLQLLKYLIPMPGNILMCLATTRRATSKPLLLALVAGLVAVIAGAAFSESRNAFVSLAIVGGVWAVSALAPRASRGAVLLGGLMPWIPIVLVWTLPVVAFLYASDIATASNLERSVSLLVSRDLIERSPLTGTGLAAFSGALTEVLQAIAGRQGYAFGPHNFYMETGVAFGIPAMVLLTITTAAMFRWGFRVSSLTFWMRGASLLLLGWIATITSLSGELRLEWLVMWVILLGLPAGEEPDGGTPPARSSSPVRRSSRTARYPVPMAARSATVSATSPPHLSSAWIAATGGTASSRDRDSVSAPLLLAQREITAAVSSGR